MNIIECKEKLHKINAILITRELLINVEDYKQLCEFLGYKPEITYSSTQELLGNKEPIAINIKVEVDEAEGAGFVPIGYYIVKYESPDYSSIKVFNSKLFFQNYNIIKEKNK